MKAVMEQWAVQIDVTNACRLQCSNCTRASAYVQKPFFMDVATFRLAVECTKIFLTESVPDAAGRHKVIGMIGGEPTLHPDFVQLAEIMEELIPDRSARGLWTSMGEPYDKNRGVIARVFGYQNRNTHRGKDASHHQPVLVAAKDLIKDGKVMWKYLEKCWLQNHWCGAVTPKGVFYCEVAAALDMVFDGPGGLPIEPYWWNRSLSDFHEQIKRWCPRCGIAIPLPGRLDSERKDDVSPTNLKALQAMGVNTDRAIPFACASYSPSKHKPGWNPRKYMRGGRR